MKPLIVIDIRPHRYGWVCEPLGPERVFVLKPQAIQFAQQRCDALPAEICVRDRNGVVRQRLRLEARQAGTNR